MAVAFFAGMIGFALGLAACLFFIHRPIMRRIAREIRWMRETMREGSKSKQVKKGGD